MKIFLTLLCIAAALGGGWFLRDHFGGMAMATATPSAERKVLFYQSAMHPWIKSDKPGRCTICGMALTPVYEGEKGLDVSSGGDTVVLTQSQIQVLHVETAEAKVQPLSMTLRVAGSLEEDASRHRILSSYIDGRIDKLYVNFMGAQIKEGQPLVEFYSPTLLQAERDYRQLTGDLKKNTGLRLRQMGLAPAQIAALETKSGDALTSQILAPVSGTVVEQKVFEGQYVKEGDKLFEIADFSTMWFQFRAYEQDMPWIQIGQSVTVTTPSLPGKSFEGKVTFIDPNFDDATRSTKVRVELANPLINDRRMLLYRLYADGDLKVDVPSVLAVPRSAVIEAGPQAVVYVEQGGGAYARTVVKLGRHGDSLIEIMSGLKAGDRVVTNGNLLIDGQAEMNRSFMTPVEPMKPAAPLAELTDKQKQAIDAFIKVADAMAKALAADDLPEFNNASEPAMMLTGDLVTSLRSPEGISETLDALDKARHFHGFDDIAQARMAFHKFSVAATAVLEPLRMAEGVPAFDVWECFMVHQAIPGAPKKGHWLQAHGRAGENPFFGKEMLNCAKEIKHGGDKP
ncbi:MAG: efflux RND transporter periplasmic adaptor subunit [Prosthecobacter sp.]|uniref:efflux RND transporter periplasmic adaptor subunit n=1 Tax=Prosthecobacter sp. TaxID=1965333 RepID=UPI0025DFCBCC|nr:efflux RND transporter periplasmic adaptor subunit [Prosthecobacter sp.]MCF7787719.1 efflux RND transporter periplasmic adaptor subunit [Prosthecobacter sp.]